MAKAILRRVIEIEVNIKGSSKDVRRHLRDLKLNRYDDLSDIAYDGVINYDDIKIVKVEDD
ncbi:MAG: hypothetical protein WC284_12195 [Candidimonas sp.]